LPEQKIESVINMVLFGIPCPKYEFNELTFENNEVKFDKISKPIKLTISEDYNEHVYFKNQNLFDLHNF
jgi:hypothetical protein